MMGGSNLKVAFGRHFGMDCTESKGGFSGIADCFLKAAYIHHSNQI